MRSYISKKNPYNNTRWRKLRLRHLREKPLCEYCLHRGKTTPASHVDHAIPFDDDTPELMYEEDNLISACPRCHQLITIQQQHMNFSGMTFSEAKVFKISSLRAEVGLDGYY